MQGLIILLFISFALCWKFFENEYESYLENEPTIVRLKNKLIPYFPEISYIRMMKGDSSYTINKQKIYICTESGGDTYDDNMLTYVILHELAHTLCPDIGHGSKFQIIFKSLLERAERNGLYDPSKPRVENYCNIR
ncbi:013L [Cherax quadricarinatus iridovirus]|uniref:013L n=1 Tax=Cherax quadricarinatus iridovirus TaxID=2035708 RepID=UPI000BBF46E4|nr:013L [Cherax quadricarinatus iridovirus]UPA43333.1 013L [Iridovirus CN01]ASZ84993.1 013L [Cherax quadricarinatus iridovirus]UPA43568.1 013L [Iridovirus CN01]UPA43603.1 013L [Iridovirus CN01]UPA43765.1 013L [Iridovirus CN01]